MYQAAVHPAAGAEAAGGRNPVDLVHLARHTLGNRALEQEVLRLFQRQTELVLQRLASAKHVKVIADQAHTIKGSARGIGAWKVAMAAEALEAEAAAGSKGSLLALESAISEANRYIADILQTG